MAKTILVADDSKTMRRAVELTFERSGFEVISVGSGHEALDRAPGLQPDIILCDVAMADADGYTVCTTLKQQATTGHIPVILLGGGGHPVDVSKASMAQADGHARKPFDTGELIQLVKQLTGVPLDAERPMTFAAALARRQAPPPPAAPVAPPSPPPVAFLGQATPPPVAFAPPTPAPLEAPDGAPSPFAAPRAERRMPSVDVPLVSDDIELEEEVVIEDVDVVEDGEGMLAAGPSLEPPTPPSDLGPRPHVDVWALADGHDGPVEVDGYDEPAFDEESYEDEPEELEADALEPVSEPPSPFTAPTRDVRDDEPTRDLRQSPGVTIDTLAAAAAPQVATVVASAVPGLSRDELVALAREIIEQVAWEVVPELAETIIREELHRLVGD